MAEFKENNPKFIIGLSKIELEIIVHALAQSSTPIHIAYEDVQFNLYQRLRDKLDEA